MTYQAHSRKKHRYELKTAAILAADILASPQISNVARTNAVKIWNSGFALVSASSTK
jgi:hypothetical protein